MASNVSPDQRALIARMAAHTMHAAGKGNTAPARAARFKQFESAVDPDGILPPKERARRAKHAQKAHMLSMSLKAAKLRQGRGR
jgi:hypothetical protein